MLILFKNRKKYNIQISLPNTSACIDSSQNTNTFHCFKEKQVCTRTYLNKFACMHKKGTPLNLCYLQLLWPVNLLVRIHKKRKRHKYVHTCMIYWKIQMRKMIKKLWFWPFEYLENSSCAKIEKSEYLKKRSS